MSEAALKMIDDQEITFGLEQGFMIPEGFEIADVFRRDICAKGVGVALRVRRHDNDGFRTRKIQFFFESLKRF